MPAEVSVIHPNDTGFELNQNTLLYIPVHFVRRLAVHYDGQRVFDMDCDFSVSENPSWRFLLRPRQDGQGLLQADAEDNEEHHFSGRLDLGSA